MIKKSLLFLVCIAFVFSIAMCSWAQSETRIEKEVAAFVDIAPAWLSHSVEPPEIALNVDDVLLPIPPGVMVTKYLNVTPWGLADDSENLKCNLTKLSAIALSNKYEPGNRRDWDNSGPPIHQWIKA